MKITIPVPKFLNWLFIDKAGEEEIVARSAMTGEATVTKRWGNHLASIEMQSSYRVQEKKQARKMR